MAQQANIGGNDNVTVQIVGDGNWVGIDDVRLPLALPEDRGKPAGTADLGMFYPGSGSTSFIGRERELEQIDAFLDSEAFLSFMLLIGEGGSGKTRLAQEICRARRKQGWDAGFLSSRSVAELAGRCNTLGRWRLRQDTLIVVDYAGGLAEQLHDILDCLAAPCLDSGRVRLLLLERTAGENAGWLQILLGRGGEHSYQIRRLWHNGTPLALYPLSSRESKLALMQDFLHTLGHSDTAWQQDEDLVRRLLDASKGGLPLFLMMAAYTKVYRGEFLSREDMAKEFAGKEAERIKAIGESRKLDADFLLELAACVTLIQGVEEERFGAWVKKIHTEESISSGRPRSYGDVLREVLPSAPEGEKNWLSPMRPDIIGEAFVLENLRRKKDLVLGCLKEFGLSVLDTLLRLAHDFGSAHREPLQWLDAVLESYTQPEKLAALDERIPYPSLPLTEFSLKTAQKRLQVWQERKQSGEAVSLAEYAVIQGSYALSLAGMGKHGLALEAAEEAVKTYRALAEKNSAAFRPAFAGSLNNLANILSELGQHPEALKEAREAVKTYRELAEENPAAFRSGLASALNNLANRLSEVGRREEALDVARDAAKTYRELAEENPAAFRPDLAMSLNNLANRLSDIGRPEVALNAARDAVKTYRELAEENPAAFLPNLAMSLNNLANRLSDVGRPEVALNAARDAVKTYRELAEEYPAAFRPDLAISLNNLAIILNDVGRHEEAIKAAEEAVKIFRALCASNPAAFGPLLELSLNTLDLCRQALNMDVGDVEAALTGLKQTHEGAAAS